MIEIGKYNTLTVEKLVDFGIYLTDGTDSILLPKKWVLRDMLPGKEVEVFIYKDNEERPIATTLKPYATVGEFACLKVKDLNELGAFMVWGIEKDIFVPYREQATEMQAGRRYVVYIFVDSVTDRVVASSKLSKFINQDDIDVKELDEVEILVSKKTDLGYEAIINGKLKGLIYENEIFSPIQVGDIRSAFIKKIREDNKIDLSLQARDFGISDDAKTKILEVLEQRNGFLALNDESEPDDIKEQLHMSKKSFKKAIGGLFKDKKIRITERGIELLQ
jgi:predicted RNA-binding protein (virulence factor B family)